MKNNQEIIDSFRNNLADNLQYSNFICFEDEGYYPCREGSNCCDDDYCRCYTITDCKIKFAPQVFAQGLSKDKQEIWVLSWWLKLNLKDESFEYKSCGDYYGDIIERIGISPGVLSGICDKLSNFLENNETFEQQIECLLTQEYSSVSKEAKGRKWHFKEVPVENITSQIKFKDGNSVLERIRDRPHWFSDIPLCVKYSSDKYRIIDGNHRFEIYKEPKFVYNGRGKEKLVHNSAIIVCPIEENE